MFVEPTLPDASKTREFQKFACPPRVRCFKPGIPSKILKIPRLHDVLETLQVIHGCFKRSLSKMLSRSWFQTCFEVHPYFGGRFPFYTMIFLYIFVRCVGSTTNHVVIVLFIYFIWLRVMSLWSCKYLWYCFDIVDAYRPVFFFQRWTHARSQEPCWKMPGGGRGSLTQASQVDFHLLWSGETNVWSTQRGAGVRKTNSIYIGP